MVFTAFTISKIQQLAEPNITLLVPKRMNNLEDKRSTNLSFSENADISFLLIYFLESNIYILGEVLQVYNFS